MFSDYLFFEIVQTKTTTIIKGGKEAATRLFLGGVICFDEIHEGVLKWLTSSQILPGVRKTSEECRTSLCGFFTVLVVTWPRRVWFPC